VLALGAALAAAGCEVNVKDKGELPEVNVEEGRAPDVEVKAPEVNVPEVEAPKIETPDVDLPKVDVDVDAGKDTVVVPKADVDTKQP